MEGQLEATKKMAILDGRTVPIQLAESLEELDARELACIQAARLERIRLGLPLAPEFCLERRWWQWRQADRDYTRPVEKSVPALAKIYFSYPSRDLLTNVVGILYGEQAKVWLSAIYERMQAENDARRQAAKASWSEGDMDDAICLSRRPQSWVVLQRIAESLPFYDRGMSAIPLESPVALR